MRHSHPRVELLWWEGCPSWPEALAELRAVMAELDLDPRAVQVTEVSTEQQAESESFAGSPTVRVNGADVKPVAEGETGALTCRVYRLRDGRVSPTPDPEDVRDALRAAVEEGGRDAA